MEYFATPKKSMSMLYCVAMLTFGGSNNSIIGFKMKKRKQRQMYSFYKNCILHKWTMSSMIFYASLYNIDLVWSSSVVIGPFWSIFLYSQFIISDRLHVNYGIIIIHLNLLHSLGRFLM